MLRSRWTSVDYPSPRAGRLGVRWLEAMLLETPPHPTGPTAIYRNFTSACSAALGHPACRISFVLTGRTISGRDYPAAFVGFSTIPVHPVCALQIARLD